MSERSPMSVQFWGVRGSIPAPGPHTARYGGNTPCIEVRCGERLIILDAGTGARALGSALMTGKTKIDADIFLSHCHFDHIGGLPFFAPAFAAGNRLRLWAGNLLPGGSLEHVIRQLMSTPLFPVSVEVFQAEIEYHDFRAGEVLQPAPGITVRTAALDHPDGAIGYRIEHGGRSLAYITDTETRNDECIRAIIALAENVDLMIFDCTYTEEEIARRAGWGHSTWRQGARLADTCQAKRFCVFHHDPERTDPLLDAVAAEVVAARPGSVVAREGLVIDL